MTAGVKDALRLGCAAIGFTIYPGSEFAFAQMEELRELTAEAKAPASPSWCGAIRAARNLDKAAETALDICAYAAQMAALMGANIIKVKPPTAVISLEAAKKSYEKIDGSTLAKRVEHVMQCVVQRQARRGVLRRRGEGPRRRLRGSPRHPRRRRQRQHHRPQHLPAPEGSRAGDAEQDHRHLPRQG